ncbi:MAG: nicotinate-nucleotide--dimethylbenzimidazole phosphoribosyltransferase [Syntrophobacterales bacterium]|jgi:nicotinate-nucleotide--dimethylbenzimidazole phosphoribosyltransferase|nr:nicotinate-nucleotide--dimethylbenzimidazole phosphoribosyltransferase [Syntrophobacterales bacterium]
MMTELSQIISQIEPLDPTWLETAQARLDSLTKPRGSLGRLEELAARYVAIRREEMPPLDKKRVVVFAADHGVVAEGVSAYPQEVTFQMVYNFLQGGAGINVLGRHTGAQVEVVDIGVNHDFGSVPGLISRKVAYGSRNMAQEPALTREEALRALLVGVEMAEEALASGVDALAAGDMGIGNTTPAAALASVFTGRPVGAVTGRGTGIEDQVWQHKLAVINRALALHRPTAEDPVGALAGVGGLEIAGIAGLILGAAAARRPLLLDGFIATAGALVAKALAPASVDYLIAAHRSVEPGHQIMLDSLELKPLLNLQMRLGEGTGAALGLSLLEAGVRIYRDMATFGEAGVAEQGE